LTVQGAGNLIGLACLQIAEEVAASAALVSVGSEMPRGLVLGGRAEIAKPILGL
jgi:hypothetical protein